MLNATTNTGHQAEATSLRPKPYVELFKLTINRDLNTVLYLTEHPTVVWNGKTWENFPLTFSGYNVQTTGEQSRPKLQLANPYGTFSSYIAKNVLKKATLERFMVLRSDLLEGNVNYLRNKWVVNRVLNLTRETVAFELRSIFDGVRYTLPARQFIAPEFPVTSLG